MACVICGVVYLWRNRGVRRGVNSASLESYTLSTSASEYGASLSDMYGGCDGPGVTVGSVVSVVIGGGGLLIGGVVAIGAFAFFVEPFGLPRFFFGVSAADAVFLCSSASASVRSSFQVEK